MGAAMSLPATMRSFLLASPTVECTLYHTSYHTFRHALGPQSSTDKSCTEMHQRMFMAGQFFQNQESEEFFNNKED